MGNQKLTLRERLNRPPRTVAGKLIRGDTSVSRTIRAVAQTAFPRAYALVGSGVAAIKAGGRDVRTTVNNRIEEIRAKSAPEAAAQQAKQGNALSRVWFFLANNIHYVIVAIIVVILLVFLAGRRSKKPKARKTSRSRSVARASTQRETTSQKPKTTGFSRMLKGKLYTDPKAWSSAMKKLRNN